MQSQRRPGLLIARYKSLDSCTQGIAFRLNAVEIALISLQVLIDRVQQLGVKDVSRQGAENMLARREHEFDFFTRIQRGRFFAVDIQLLVCGGARGSAIPYKYCAGAICQRQRIGTEYPFHRYRAGTVNGSWLRGAAAGRNDHSECEQYISHFYPKQLIVKR
jgi:hypothetical protein